MLTALALLLCIGAGTIGGVFFAFSAFVMKALAQLPAAQGHAAMQRINAAVLNRVFLGVFMGTALLSLGAVGASLLVWTAPRSPWLIAAGLLYGGGCFGVTIAFNVPRNRRLGSVEAGSAQAAAYWAVYVREWTRWNHVRTVAAIAASACAATALSG